MSAMITRSRATACSSRLAKEPKKLVLPSPSKLAGSGQHDHDILDAARALMHMLETTAVVPCIFDGHISGLPLYVPPPALKIKSRNLEKDTNCTAAVKKCQTPPQPTNKRKAKAHKKSASLSGHPADPTTSSAAATTRAPPARGPKRAEIERWIERHVRLMTCITIPEEDLDLLRALADEEDQERAPVPQRKGKRTKASLLQRKMAELRLAWDAEFRRNFVVSVPTLAGESKREASGEEDAE